jgi:hypothetical protein
MSQPVGATESWMPLKLNIQAAKLTEKQFRRLCQENPELRIELTAQQELVIMPPTGSETGRRNSTLTQRLANWSETEGTGIVFDSSTLFTLPNGATFSPESNEKGSLHSAPISSSNYAREQIGCRIFKTKCRSISITAHVSVG